MPCVVVIWIEPQVMRFHRKDHGHPVMNVFHDVIGFRRNNRAGMDRLVPFPPRFPKARKSKRLSVLHDEAVRLLAFVCLFPLVKSVGQDQAALLFKSMLEGRLLVNRFRPGIDHFVADFFVLGPIRNEPPFQHISFLALAVGTDGKNRLPGCNIVSRSILTGYSNSNISCKISKSSVRVNLPHIVLTSMPVYKKIMADAKKPTSANNH